MSNWQSFLLLCVIMTFSSCAGAVEIPDQFTITERVFTLMATFDIETPHSRLGYASRTLTSFLPEYRLYDNEGQLEATARMRITLFGATFDIWNDDDMCLGTVDERIFTLFPTFDILPSTGDVLATARLNFLGTTYTVRDPITFEEIATISRPFLRLFRDCWTVNILNRKLLIKKGIGLSEFALIAVFQTNREYWEEKRREQQPRGWLRQDLDLNDHARKSMFY